MSDIPIPDQPYLGRLVIFWLAAQDEMVDLVGDEICSDLAANQTFPCLRVTDHGGPADHLRHGGRTLITLEAWGSRREAHDIAETAAALLASRRFRDVVEAGETSAVISRVEAGTPHDDSDPSWEPARPRSTVDVVIHAHRRT